MGTSRLTLRLAAVLAILAISSIGNAADHAVSTSDSCHACVEGPIMGCGDWDAADQACAGSCGQGSRALQTSCQQGDCLSGQIDYLCS